jgi:hypothetical protein
LPLKVEICSETSMTFGASVESKFKVDLQLISEEVGYKLHSEVKTTRRECLSVTVPKGAIVYFAVIPIYAFRGIERDNFDRRCSKFRERIGVYTPIGYAKTILRQN